VLQVNLLHLSDLHFSFEPRRLDALSRIRLGWHDQQVLRALFRIRANGLFTSHDQDLALAVAEFALARRARLSGIIITGDLATTGLVEDLTAALAFVNEPAARGARSEQGTATLAAAGLDVFLVPGNHDRYASEFGEAGGVGFDEVFAHFWECGSRIQSVLFESERGKLGVIGADFSLGCTDDARTPCVIGRLGQGRVYGHLLEELQSTTMELRGEHPNIGIIWAVHFPPSAPGNSRGLHLINGRNLISSARAQGVRHILAGHIHADLTYMAPGKPAVTIHCANSACSVSTDGGNGFQILEVTVEDSRVAISEHGHVWDDDQGEFVVH
jgi:3',5'-cyclic AMP phosphodiesterase CpdA